MSRRNHPWFEDKGTLALWSAPGIALLIWGLFSTNGTATLLLHCYVLISTPFFVLTGSYPPVGSRWFWKAMIPIFALIGVAVYGYLQLANWLEYEKLILPARMVFGVVGIVAMLESVSALRIVEATEPRINDEE